MVFAKPSVTFLATMFILIIMVIPVHSGGIQKEAPGTVAPVIWKVNGSDMHQNHNETPETAYYLSSNLSVPANTTFSFNSDQVYADSLYLTFISIDVYGTLELLNSTMSILNASYNSVEGININLLGGSSLHLVNSVMDFPGTINASRSDVSIDNSTIECPFFGNSDPLTSGYLGENFSGSDINITNSSISGMIHQPTPCEFPDARMYINQSSYQEFSANSTVPMKYPVSSYGGNVLENGIELNVSYKGASNESGDYLQLEVNGSVVEKYFLPYHTGSSSRISESINGSMFVHTAQWFANKSNFSIVLQEDSAYPVGISNLTVTLESNDTVHARGYSAYDMMLYRSKADIVNSSLSLNFRGNTIGDGIPDFMANHIYSQSSTITWIDSSVSGNSNYNSSPFQLYNSTVYMYRLAKIQPEDEGAVVTNFRYSISSAIPLPYSLLNDGGMNMTQYEPLSSHRFIGMSGIQANSSYLYCGEYRINWGTNETTVSLAPFPKLPMATATINVTVPVPLVTLKITGATVQNGNLTVNITYSADSTDDASFNGTVDIFTMDKNGTRNAVSTAQISGLQFQSMSLKYHVRNGGNLTQVEATFLSVHMYAISSRSVEISTIDHKYPAISPIRVSVTVTGYVQGTTWILDYGGRYFIASSSSLEFSSSVNLTPGVIPPTGYLVSSEVVSYGAGNSEMVEISFSRITETVTFVEAGSGAGQQWSVLIAGRDYSTTDSALNVNLSPGIYNYQVGPPKGLEIRKSSGIVNLTDSNTTISVAFYPGFSPAAFLRQVAGQIAFYAFLATAAGIVVAGISIRKRHSWYICRSCGVTVDKGMKYCDKCSTQRK